MLASLALPRVAVSLLALFGVAGVSLCNLLAGFGVELTGLAGAVERVGPPLCGAVIAALAPWTGESVPVADSWVLLLRLAAWAVVSCALLLAAFAVLPSMQVIPVRADFDTFNPLGSAQPAVSAINAGPLTDAMDQFVVYKVRRGNTGAAEVTHATPLPRPASETRV